LDSTTFILLANRTKKTVLHTLKFELEPGFLLVDISENNIEDFFVDNSFDQTHLHNFIEEYHNERDKCSSNSSKTLSELDIILDKISAHGIDELTWRERKRLEELSN